MKLTKYCLASSANALYLNEVMVKFPYITNSFLLVILGLNDAIECFISL